jgi:hypothetical protein
VIAEDVQDSERAMGGNEMLGTKSRVAKEKCGHTDAVTVVSTGIERTVCENCGDLSFRFVDAIAISETAIETSINRDMFARVVDREPELAVA